MGDLLIGVSACRANAVLDHTTPKNSLPFSLPGCCFYSSAQGLLAP
jgi:hypothetical protein